MGHGATLDNGCLVLSKMGRLAMRWSRPLVGTPKTLTVSREAEGWSVAFSCAEVPPQPLLPTRRETGLDVGLKGILLTAAGEAAAGEAAAGEAAAGEAAAGEAAAGEAAAGEAAENPRPSRRAEKRLAKAQPRLARRKTGSKKGSKTGSKRHEKARVPVATPHQQGKRQRREFHHQTALALLGQYDVLSLADRRVANLVRHRHLSSASPLRMPAGASSASSLKPKQPTLGVKWGWWPLPTRRRTVVAAGSAGRRA